MTIDEKFISRVYRSSIYVWAFGVVACLAFRKFDAAAGWTIGSALSVGILRSLEWIVRECFVPGAKDAKQRQVKFSLVKLPMVLMTLGLVVWLGRNSFALVAAFCTGVILTQSVIFLKIIGVALTERLKR